MAKGLSRLPRSDDPSAESTLRSVTEAWTALAERSARLPKEAPSFTALVLVRAAARTIFLFGDGPEPLLVAKVPHLSGKGVEREAAALQEIEGEAVAPRYLGRAGNAHLQEALPGEPLEVVPLSSSTISRLRWTQGHAAVAGALLKIAGASSKAALPDEFSDQLIQRTVAGARLTKATTAALDEAVSSLALLEGAVLKHGDTSAQNCLLDPTGAAYLVDWEGARTSGAPGFDVWNFALAYLEHGVGLKRWSQQEILRAFRSSWNGPFFQEARSAARRAAIAGGADEAHLRPLEIAFFGRRVAHRIATPDAFPTTVGTATEMLEIVCAS
jgi:hypothetical protein